MTPVSPLTSLVQTRSHLRVLIVNSENLNFADSDEDFRWLLERIAGMRGRREFFSRG